jgi:TolA-binding protein
LLPHTSVVAIRTAAEARGLPWIAANRMQPWMLAAAIARPNCEIVAASSGSPVLDKLIVDRAREEGKELASLESIEDQFASVASVPRDFHINALTDLAELGELADDVTSPAESAPQPKKKPAHRKAQVATAAVAVSAEDAEKNSDAIQHFTRGVNLMRKGSYADAVLIFTQFVERYPEHALASSAQFHAGECYFQMGEYKLAISEYEKMLRSYGNHPRVPSALVRLSQAYNAIGNTSEGSKYKDLAQANFAGNPSLDWPAPATRAAAPVAAKEQPVPQQKTATLETAPMEISTPHEEAH